LYQWYRWWNWKQQHAIVALDLSLKGEEYAAGRYFFNIHYIGEKAETSEKQAQVRGLLRSHQGLIIRGP